MFSRTTRRDTDKPFQRGHPPEPVISSKMRPGAQAGVSEGLKARVRRGCGVPSQICGWTFENLRFVQAVELRCLQGFRFPASPVARGRMAALSGRLRDKRWADGTNLFQASGPESRTYRVQQ